MEHPSYTQDELHVASILLEISSLWNLTLPFDQVKWGAKQRRTEPPYRHVAVAPPPAPVAPLVEEERKRLETSSPSTPLSFPTSCGEEFRVPKEKRGKKEKPTKHREWVKEKKEMVAALSERKSDLLREIGVVTANFQRLQALNSFLRDQKPKLLHHTQVNEEIMPRQISQPGSSNQDLPPGATWTAPQPVLLGIEQRRVLNFDLNESPCDDVAELTWPAKTAKELRRERLEKQREKNRGRISRTEMSESTAQKRPRVR